MSKLENRNADWADDEDEDPSALPPPQTFKNPDNTETQISYRWREDGQKIKITRIVRRSVVKHTVNPRIAERRTWAKFGMSANDAPGPQHDTTSVGENIELNLRQNFKEAGREEAANAEMTSKVPAKGGAVKCRICSGEHFTARCPFKGTMAPEGEPSGEPVQDPLIAEAAVGTVKGAYVAPGRRGGDRPGEKMAGKFERDDLATLRVTNVSEYAEESELRDLFERCGRVTRVFLAKDRDTGRAKGFAFVSFADRSDASKACAKMDGFGYNNLILRVEFAKKTT